MIHEVILENYEINKDTVVLMPARHIDYETIVLERNAKFYVKKTPLELIRAACLEGGSTYEGRREAVIALTGSQNKVPIPIEPLQHIYAFPTHSPKQFDCCWLFYHHVKSMKPHPKSSSKTLVTFKNSRELTVPVSYYSLEKQMLRTSQCILRFSYRHLPPTLMERASYWQY